MNHSEDDEQDFMESVEENRWIQTVFERYKVPEDFLCFREEKVYARSTTVNKAEQDTFLLFSFDIDGCVVELKDFDAITFPVRHLTFFPKGLSSMSPLKPLLGKHVNLVAFNASEMMAFNNCVGFQLFYEHGWECYIGLIPRNRGRLLAMSKEAVRNKCVDSFKVLKTKFEQKMLQYAAQGVARPTLMKNDLNDIRRIFVLPDDSRTIIRGLQDIVSLFCDSEFRIITFLFRFGEKMTNGVSLDCFDMSFVESVTVHAAVNIHSTANISLLWSMSGLQQIVGQRGTLRTCLSFSDCATFSSNLDEKGMDLSVELKQICAKAGSLRFMQTYADVPHLRPKTRFHPVSGYIGGSKCFTKASSQAYKKDSEKYISTLESIWVLFRKASCRMEFVIDLSTIPSIVKAEDCIDMMAVERLLMDRPVIVPFPDECLQCIPAIGGWMAHRLRELQESCAGTGNTNAIWESYQLELASEKLVWGHPFCYRSNPLSINLGPGILRPTRSRTDYLGFLALETCTSCMSDEKTIPPPLTWTPSDVICKRLQRFVGLHDYIKASACVLGRRVVIALLFDLYETGKASTFMRFEHFLSGLKTTTNSFRVIGACSAKTLAQTLSIRRRVSFPMVFGLHFDMLQKEGLCITRLIEAGLSELRLHKFPAIVTTDKDRHAMLRWNWRNHYWQVLNLGDEGAKDQPSGHQLTLLVKTELEKRGLIFISKLKKVPVTFPWVSHCVRKLSDLDLSLEETVTTLTYISCSALVSQGWYVDFDALSVLHAALPIPAGRLVDCEILVRFILRKFPTFKLHRVHPSIPHKLDISPESTQSSQFVDPDCIENLLYSVEQEESRAESIKECDTMDNPAVIECRAASCVPVGSRTYNRWSSEELENLESMLAEHASESVADQFVVYRDHCLRVGVPVRTLRSFENRVRRMRSRIQT